MQKPAVHIKTLAKALKGRQAALDRATKAFADAKAALEEKEDTLRTCRQEVDKITIETEQAESLRTQSEAPKLVIDEE